MEKYINKLKLREKMTTEPKYHDDLIALYTAFRDTVFNPKSVLHPSCYDDASPSKVFADVTYVDLESGIMEMFRQHGLDAHGCDIREYKPAKEHDALILLNPCIATEWASQHIRKGAYILTNNYHGNATGMYKQPDLFELVGTLDFVEPDRRKGDNRVVFSRNVEGLFEPVAHFEELRALRPGTYDFIMSAHKHMWSMFGFKGTDEEMYLQEREMGGEERVLPSKRVAERYVFMKR